MNSYILAEYLPYSIFIFIMLLNMSFFPRVILSLSSTIFHPRGLHLFRLWQPLSPFCSPYTYIYHVFIFSFLASFSFTYSSSLRLGEDTTAVIILYLMCVCYFFFFYASLDMMELYRSHRSHFYTQHPLNFITQPNFHILLLLFLFTFLHILLACISRFPAPVYFKVHSRVYWLYIF